MIANEKQLQITKRHLQDFRVDLEALESRKVESDDILHAIHINTVKAKIDDFENEIREYESLKNGEISHLVISVDHLPDALIKGRIARKWSQSELAKKLDMAEQQIQRYEACKYSSISFGKMHSIANVIGLTFGEIKVKMKEEPIVIEGINQEEIVNIQNKIKARKALIDYQS